TFWGEFGPVLKEGLVGYETPDKDKILELLLAPSTADASALTSLDEYVGRMKEGQEAIYVLTGPKESIAKSPLLEAFVAKGYEVLLFSDANDELWLERAPRFKDKPVQSIARGDAKLGSEDERKKDTEALEAKQKDYGDLLALLRVHLQDEIKEV